MLKLILLTLCLFSYVLPQSTLQKKLKEDREKKAQEEIKSISKELEEKLKRLEEERKKLEEFRRTETRKEEPREDIKKLVEIFNRTSPEEAGAIMNNLSPSIAAEVLLQLKERQAAAILESMDPKKAAEVSALIVERRRRR